MQSISLTSHFSAIPPRLLFASPLLLRLSSSLLRYSSSTSSPFEDTEFVPRESIDSCKKVSLPPLDAPHQLRKHELTPYQEGSIQKNTLIICMSGASGSTPFSSLFLYAYLRGKESGKKSLMKCCIDEEYIVMSILIAMSLLPSIPREIVEELEAHGIDQCLWWS